MHMSRQTTSDSLTERRRAGKGQVQYNNPRFPRGAKKLAMRTWPKPPGPSYLGSQLINVQDKHNFRLFLQRVLFDVRLPIKDCYQTFLYI